MLYSSFHYNRMSCCPKRKVSVSCSCGLCSWPLGYPPGAIPKALPGGSAHPTRFSPTEVASARLQAVLWLSSGSGISKTKLPVPDMGRGRQGLGMTTVRPHRCTCQAYEKRRSLGSTVPVPRGPEVCLREGEYGTCGTSRWRLSGARGAQLVGWRKTQESSTQTGCWEE